MMKFIPLLFVLSGCTFMFRGSFLDVEEFSFGPTPKGKTEIIKEIIVDGDKK